MDTHKPPAGRDLPVPLSGFQSEFLDFRRGIRVGHLEPHQRITQILKHSLESIYQCRFVIDRYGRGVYWRWICFLSKENRAVKRISHSHNFGCAKFFVMLDPSEALFKAGVHVERGFLQTTDERVAYRLRDDWDWHRLLDALEKEPFYRQLRRLVMKDGFSLFAGAWKGEGSFSKSNLPSASDLKRIMQDSSGDEWALFQIYYATTPEQVQVSTGADLMESVLAVFQELTPIINHCMQIRIESSLGRESSFDI